MSVFETRDFDGMHPLVLALKHTDTTILKLLAGRLSVTRISRLPSYLLQELGHLASVLVPARKCSLLCLIEADWPTDGAHFLLENNVFPNSTNMDELPPLLVALWTNNVPLFQLLLRYRASPNIYHKNVTGNVAMLMAFQKDLERDLTTMIVRNSRQPNFQIFFIWQLFLAGAESHSLFNINDPLSGGNANGPAITNLFGLMFHMFHRKENLVPVLALLMYISDHASLPRNILSHFDEDDRNKLRTISGRHLIGSRSVCII